MYSFLDNNKSIVLQHILELKHTYPPNKHGKYSKEDRIEFVKRVSHQQLEKFYSDWYKSIQSHTIDLSVFKSLRAQLCITFYKFYIQKDRKPRTSDIIDISMCASFPYVDSVITEKNLVNDIQQIQKQNIEFNNTIAYTLKDIKEAYL